jgi:thioesterase domain-containing protein
MNDIVKSEARTAREAVLVGLFNDADGLISRMEALQASVPQQIAQLDEAARGAAATVETAAQRVREQVLPSLSKTLQDKAQEHHSALIVSISKRASDAVTEAFKSGVAPAAERVSQMVTALESATAQLDGKLHRHMMLVAGISSLISALVTAAICVVVLR